MTGLNPNRTATTASGPRMAPWQRQLRGSPHIAAQTQEAMARVAGSAAQAILDDLAGRRPEYVYNPEVYEVRTAKGLFGGAVL